MSVPKWGCRAPGCFLLLPAAPTSVGDCRRHPLFLTSRHLSLTGGLSPRIGLGRRLGAGRADAGWVRPCADFKLSLWKVLR